MMRLVHCELCSLNYDKPDISSRIVPGRGNLNGWLLIVGQAPGKEEEAKKVPFIGKCGRLLRKCAEEAGLDLPHEVFITNTVLCYPPGDREPTIDEMKSCEGRLWNTIKYCEPIILCLGNIAASSVLQQEEWQWNHVYSGLYPMNDIYPRIVIPVKHPSWYLRNRNEIKNLTSILRTIKEKYRPNS